MKEPSIMRGIERCLNRVPAIWVAAISFATFISGEERVDFNRDGRPILTKHCTACHGGVKEAGNISFIYRDKALGMEKSGEYPILPGKPAESDILRRLRSSDPDEVMPKPKHGPPLPAAETALIERWIRQSAE
jgi:hypothetical protein